MIEYECSMAAIQIDRSRNPIPSIPTSRAGSSFPCGSIRRIKIIVSNVTRPVPSKNLAVAVQVWRVKGAGNQAIDQGGIDVAVGFIDIRAIDQLAANDLIAHGRNGLVKVTHNILRVDGLRLGGDDSGSKRGSGNQ